MPRIYTSANDPLDFCRTHFPSETRALEEFGSVGDGPDGRGNCFDYDASERRMLMAREIWYVQRQSGAGWMFVSYHLNRQFAADELGRRRATGGGRWRLAHRVVMC